MKVLNYTGLQNLWTNIKNYITVHTPTKTSDLTNDSGFLTSTDISSKANDSEVLHKAQNETVTGEKTFKKDVKIIDLNANERPGVQFEVNGTFRTFEQAEDSLPDDNSGGGISIGIDSGFNIGGLDSVWSGFVLEDNVKLQNSMSDYVINDITFGSTHYSSVIELNNYYKVKYNDDSGMQTDLRGMLRFELLPYANVEKGDQLWSNPNLYFYAMLDGESGNTILGHENAHWSKAYIDEINCTEINIGGNSITSVLENILSLSYVTHYSSTSLTSNSTNSLSVIDNQDSIRVNDKVIDSSGKMFYITSVDYRNGEFDVGSVVDTFAKDSAVVHNSGAETIAGIKTFSDDTIVSLIKSVTNLATGSTTGSNILPLSATITYTDGTATKTAKLNFRIQSDGSVALYPHENGIYSLGLVSRNWDNVFSYMFEAFGKNLGNEFSNNARTNLYLKANRDTSGQSGVYISKFRQNRAQGEMGNLDVVQVTFDVLENSVRTNRTWYLNYLNWENDVPKTVEIRSLCEKVDYKLTHINDLTPSSLGMPDLNSGVDISSYITVVANANKESLYTPPANGWICVRLSRTSGALGVLLIQGGMASSGKNIEVESGVTTADAMLPVVGGVQVSINSALADGVVSAYFYPCFGNV